MKNKLIIIVCCVFALLQPTQAQTYPEFAPIGAKWWYKHRAYYPTPATEVRTFATYECVGDTVVNGSLLKRIKFYKNVTSWNDWQQTSFFYMYQNGPNVYTVSVYEDEVHLGEHLYDFSAGVGDSWYLSEQTPQTEDQNVLNTVTAVDSILINGLWVKRQHVETSGYLAGLVGWGFWGTHIAYIGNTDFFEPLEKFGELTEHLRCYEDPTLGIFYETGVAPFCEYEYIVSTEDDWGNFQSGIHIFPSPATNELQLRVVGRDLQEQPLRFELYDMQGRQALNLELQNGIAVHQLTLGELAQGLYVYKVYSQQKQLVASGKITLF
ncbi:T9SS C-terminal target domain-containing protein [Sphingobacteriales bacterium UPWRP_1]|nr:hypothetical protein BVG80_02965 [Sphingobacteriales bacterium TSM_CSM]PSJ75448.1 T9SS C-terminal target domain-containing protein [Sphingobacteriales bacterium UPWRP_1]